VEFMKKIALLALILLTACAPSASPAPESFFAATVQPGEPGAAPVVTESAPIVEEDAGDLYFFLQPRQAQSGQPIQLTHVAGACVSDSAQCPPLEVIPVPFALNFTINALSWSPDGRFAAFAYSDDPNGTPSKLWLFDASARTWNWLAQFPYIDPPFWSPDGTWIAFRTQDGLGGEDVYVTRTDGSELKSVSAGLPPDGRPYRMDGWFAADVLVRSVLPGHEGQVYLLSPMTGQARPMFDFAMQASFVAAPDAHLIAFDDYDSASQIHALNVMSPGGMNTLTLAQFGGGRLYPLVWSADSKFIAFNYYNGPAAEVYVVDSSGGTPSLVYSGVTVGRLIFSPNGKYLLVEETTSATGGHLFLVNLATLEKKILQAPGLSTDYDWYAPSWSP
jgi:dipeptidyl aminopeptidase/acylaminoacyl peptidase